MCKEQKQREKKERQDIWIKHNKTTGVINYIKCTNNPDLNLQKEHLKSCNFFNYQEVTKEPILGYDKCDNNNAKF